LRSEEPCSRGLVTQFSYGRPWIRVWFVRPYRWKSSADSSMKSIVHWGSSEVTGRGLLALVGHGQVYAVELTPGEQYIAHPRYIYLSSISMTLAMCANLNSHIIAYTMMSNPPRPYRFKSTSLRLQVPELRHLGILTQSKFIRDLAGSDTWKALMRIVHNLRTWSRKTIWGDRVGEPDVLTSDNERTPADTSRFKAFPAIRWACDHPCAVALCSRRGCHECSHRQRDGGRARRGDARCHSTGHQQPAAVRRISSCGGGSCIASTCPVAVSGSAGERDWGGSTEHRHCSRRPSEV
jgi:hypothetical protein